MPAIDLRAGRSVRLLRGDFSAETVYGDPLDQALRYEKAGAAILHLVDLDAARTGDPVNAAVIAEITRAVAIPVEVGGGVRSAERAEALFADGVDRVVLGTRAVEDPEFACDLAARHPGRVVLGLDYRIERDGDVVGRVVAVDGWEVASGKDLFGQLASYRDAPFVAVVATDIDQDGTLAGPDLEGYAALLDATSIPVVASGGVGTLDHLRALAKIERSGRGLVGAIVGKALVEGAFTVEEAVAACRP